MSKPISIQIGNLLYKHLFPVYNIVYPIFKNRQDADEINYLKKIIKPGDTILDIGANIGFYSKILAQCTGKYGKVHSFEPDLINFKHLKKNTRGLVNIVLNNKAVSDKSGTINIYKSKDLNVDHRTYPVGEYESIDVIEAISIDEYLNNSWKVNLIKMDIQGFEVSAMKGMEKTIKANPELKMLLEFWPHGLHAAGSSVAQFCEVIKSLGLKIEFLENEKLLPFDEANIPEYETWGWGQYKNILVTAL
ncbi:MAG: FkbM family methyltransferase [Bacteroidia bacterium]